MSDTSDANEGTDAAETFPLTFPIAKPIQHGTELVSSLILRQPGAGDMIAVGNPVDFDPLSDPPKIAPDMKKMAAMISRLANVPPSVVAQMSTKELSALSWTLAPFFIPV